jgi:hypothetical protein
VSLDDLIPKKPAANAPSQPRAATRPAPRPAVKRPGPSTAQARKSAAAPKTPVVAAARPGTPLLDCIIQGNGANGANIMKGGDPVFRRCRILENAGVGILSTDGGLGTLDDCDVTRNRGGNAVSNNQGRLVIRASRTD